MCISYSSLIASEYCFFFALANFLVKRMLTRDLFAGANVLFLVTFASNFMEEWGGGTVVRGLTRGLATLLHRASWRL